MLISNIILLRVRNVLEKSFVEEIKIHVLYPITYFSASRAVYEIKRKNMVHMDGPQMKI